MVPLTSSATLGWWRLSARLTRRTPFISPYVTDACESTRITATHVVSIIGLQRALECNSLPRYKVRRDHWRMMIDARARCRPSESEASQLFRK